MPFILFSFEWKKKNIFLCYLDLEKMRFRLESILYWQGNNNDGSQSIEEVVTQRG